MQIQLLDSEICDYSRTGFPPRLDWPGEDHHKLSLLDIFSHIEHPHSEGVTDLLKDEYDSVDVSVPVIHDASLCGVLDSVSEQALEALEVYIKNYIATEGVPVQEINISAVIDPDNTFEIVVSLRVHMGSESAMKFWSKLDENIEHWLVTQPDAVRNAVIEQFFTSVQWDDASA